MRPSARLVAFCLVAVAGVAAWWLLADPFAAKPAFRPEEDLDRNFFAPRVADVAPDRVHEFASGARMFTREWITRVSGPDVPFDGLGPTFIETSCLGCHVNGGRSLPPQASGQSAGTMVIRLSQPGVGVDGAPGPHPAYGEQLDPRAIVGVPAEGRAMVDYTEMPGIYGDGTGYSLARPAYRFTDLAFGPLGNVLVSARIAQPQIGLGFLEGVPVAALAALADPDDSDSDGISGRINWVVDHNGKRAAGRFGWKALAPDLVEQSGAAGLQDMGLTNRARREANCPPVQVACREAAVRARTDMSDNFFDNLVTYLRMTTIPGRRGAAEPEAVRGEMLFGAFGCAQCHRPSLDTGPGAPLPELRNQRFAPYTDLLLHDMGEALADGRPEGSASGTEWRTSPLWGIGLTETVNGDQRFLHDGRARGLAEAILWHGGEAEKAREAFRNAPAADRSALLAFLKSL